MLAQRRGGRLEVAARIQPLDALQPFGIDGHHVREGAVLLAGLLHDDLAVLLEDLGLDLSRLTVDELAEAPGPVEDGRTYLLHAAGTERVRLARPTELGERPLAALQQRGRSPLRLDRGPLELCIVELDGRPGSLCRRRCQSLQGTLERHFRNLLALLFPFSQKRRGTS